MRAVGRMRDAMRSLAHDALRKSGRKGQMMRHAIIVALVALLTGCATGGSDVRPAMCGWMVTYAPAMQARAAEELDALPVGSVLRVLVDDYGELRARIRAACAR